MIIFNGNLLHLTLLLCICATGCSLGNEIANFGNAIVTPEYHSFEPQAQLLARGNYDRLSYVSWASDGTIVVARHLDGATVSIALLPLDGSGGCESAGMDFLIHSPDLDASQHPIDNTGEVVVMDDPDGDSRGAITFVDAHCSHFWPFANKRKRAWRAEFLRCELESIVHKGAGTSRKLRPECFARFVSVKFV